MDNSGDKDKSPTEDLEPIESLTKEEALEDIESIFSDDEESLKPLPPQEKEPAPEEKPPPDALKEIQDFAQKSGVGEPMKMANTGYPFSLKIEGHLSDTDREKLLSVLQNHKMGIDEKDLSPQWDTGQILIPRISEYAGVLIVQAIYDCGAKFYLGPADQIFSTADTQEAENDLKPPNLGRERSESWSARPRAHADEIPILSHTTLPESFEAIDGVSASATLRSASVEARESLEFQELVDSLQRELKYKAFRKGAEAVSGFKVELAPLSQSNLYRLIAIGTAVRRR